MTGIIYLTSGALPFRFCSVVTEIEEQIKDKEIDEITAIDLYQFNEFIVECFEKYNISIDDLNQLSPD